MRRETIDVSEMREGRPMTRTIDAVTERKLTIEGIGASDPCRRMATLC